MRLCARTVPIEAEYIEFKRKSLYRDGVEEEFVKLACGFALLHIRTLQLMLQPLLVARDLLNVKLFTKQP
ncbi:unnamed protein product [Wuchereria bancrofti]|uniref:Uncharacterized protein n=1 Tax=Wuchereria bancrofti TaxID=6293 RepID=A0A3P7FYI7_WUCBA|nr:unnamed protein product [Wuchereria bancrofti]